MTRPQPLGEFEHLVLLAVLRLGGEGYGMRVRREIERRTGREASAGAVYATLERLEEKGFVRSTVGDPIPERGGRARRTFQVTAAGTRALGEARRVIERMWEGLSPERGPA
jgi:PadR family transcriptional regulator, regulatory protein PadR